MKNFLRKAIMWSLLSLSSPSYSSSFSGYYAGGIFGTLNQEITLRGTEKEDNDLIQFFQIHQLKDSSYGGHMGYLSTLSSKITWGLDLSISTGATKTVTFPEFKHDDFVLPCPFTSKIQEKFTVAALAKLGYAFESIMPYAEAGFQLSKIQTELKANLGRIGEALLDAIAQQVIDEGWADPGEIAMIKGQLNLEGNENKKKSFSVPALVLGIGCSFKVGSSVLISVGYRQAFLKAKQVNFTQSRFLTSIAYRF